MNLVVIKFVLYLLWFHNTLDETTSPAGSTEPKYLEAEAQKSPTFCRVNHCRPPNFKLSRMFTLEQRRHFLTSLAVIFQCEVQWRS